MTSQAARDLDQVFPTRSSPSHAKRGSPSSKGYSDSYGTGVSMGGDHHGGSNGSGRGGSAGADGSAGGSGATSSRFAAQLKSCEMRHAILSNEMDDVRAEEDALLRRRTKVVKGEAGVRLTPYCAGCYLMEMLGMSYQ